ncbi:MAG: LysM peptidoglycan-binding domain-containing protein [Sporolactobacillus sp.]
MKTKMLSVALVGGLVVTGIGTHPAKAASAATPVDLAEQSIGQAYSWGANDCSGFTMRVFSHFGVQLPHNSAAQAGYGTPVSQADLQPGDLVFFRTSGSGISHVGIYVGNNRMISAENEQTGVRETQIFGGGASSYWQPRFVTARRIMTRGQAQTSQPVQEDRQSSNSVQTKSSKTSSNPANTGSSSQPAATVQTNNGSDSQQAASQQPAQPTTQQSTESKAQQTVSADSQSSSNTTVQTKPADNQSTTSNKPASKPSTASNPVASPAQTAKVHPKSGVYVVTSGDSLWVIANHNGITVAKIKSLNHLSSTVIQPGQKLLLQTSLEKYTVKSGDTLWKIAKEHNTTVKQLMESNHLSSDLIFPEHQLSLPQK